ncbi:MAG: STAS domain-containing protein [Victivallales bacterium]|nr:STAS domain-containing protein [Victivallales bacterium]
MDIEILSESIGDILKITVKGKLLAHNAKDFAHELEYQLPTHQKLVFDLAALDEIDYEGLRTFVSSLQWAYLKGCIAKLAAIQPTPRILFDITRVSQVFQCFDTVEEALDALQNAENTATPPTP